MFGKRSAFSSTHLFAFSPAYVGKLNTVNAHCLYPLRANIETPAEQNYSINLKKIFLSGTGKEAFLVQEDIIYEFEKS